jgi:hypothetical protein
MASSASDLIKFEKMATGEKSGTWGTLANKAMSRLEEAMHDITNISLNALGGANYTLDDTQYEEHDDSTPAQESHVAAIKATGTLDANEVILVPARNHIYWVWNATSGSFTVTVNISGGAGVEVPQGYLAAVLADGTNVEALTPPVSATGAMTMYGRELFLDADGDTSITADTDDQIDIKIAGADDFQFTANTLSVLSGSTLNIDSGATIANSGTATGFGGVDTTGTPANNQLAIFTDADTVEGDSNLTYDGTDLILAGGNINVSSGNGIDFSATGDSNAGMTSELFDNYEEGYYDPVLGGGTSGTFTAAAGNNTLAYTIIGRCCYIRGSLHIDSESSPVGMVQMSLPVAIASLTDSAETGYISGAFVTNTGGTHHLIVGYLEASNNTVRFYEFDTEYAANGLDATEVDTSFGIRCNFWYVVD